jgi:isoleucyl-tRNA synthetase
LFFVRNQAFQLIEAFRQDLRIGKSTEAEIQILTRGSFLERLRAHAGTLKEFLNVSQVHVEELSDTPGEIEVPEGVGPYKALTSSPNLQFVIYAATGHKCARCWNFMPEVSNYGIWENVCTRCQSALREMHIEPPRSVAAQAEANQ